MGIIDSMVDLLESTDTKTLAIVLEALNNILNVGK